jgi:glycosyltransferase involved in cell wall biosynthesis
MAGRLEKLQESLQRIPFSNVEVLLIDDHQDEDTKMELSEIILKIGNPNITITSGIFGNPGAARNAGLKISRGKWITFWDSDDIGFIDPIIDEIERASEEVDVIIGQFKIHDIRNSRIFSRIPIKSVSQISKSPGIWRFVFKNIDLIEYKSLSMGEDQLFIAENLSKSKRIHISEEIFCIYTVGDSNQLTYSKSKINDLLKVASEMNNLKMSNDSERLLLVISMRLRMYLSLIKYGKTIAKFIASSNLIRLFPRYIFKRLYRALSVFVSTRSQDSIIISVTGGLGNQLFQIAAANALSSPNVPDAVFGLGIPRKSSAGKPDILDFNTHGIIGRSDLRTANLFFQKVAGFNLRMGVSPRRYEINIFKSAIRMISNSVLSVYVRKRVSVISAKGVGYDNLVLTSRSHFLFGYFQSYKWITQPKVINKFKNIHLMNESRIVNSYLDSSAGLRVLGIHIRLGDYKVESDFGILSQEYYQNSLNAISSKVSYDRIWIFSDEPQLASSIHSFSTMIPIEWIDNTNLSASETLQLFRRCDGYIIANSSFSWWAAMLSQAVNPIVIAPTKWFRNLEDPKELIPPSWLRVNSTFFSAEQISNLINKV